MSLRETMIYCQKPGCLNHQKPGMALCQQCVNTMVQEKPPLLDSDIPARRTSDVPLSELYPKYYKPIPKGWDSIDVYGVHYLFKIDDPAGMIQHASKKLLLSGVRTGGKTQRDDIREARDTLNRWLQMNS